MRYRDDDFGAYRLAPALCLEGESRISYEHAHSDREIFARLHYRRAVGWHDRNEAARKRLGAFVLGALLGIRVLSRTRPDRKLLAGIGNPLFRSLRGP
jgi:hypothetical protein